MKSCRGHKKTIFFSNIPLFSQNLPEFSQTFRLFRRRLNCSNLFAQPVKVEGNQARGAWPWPKYLSWLVSTVQTHLVSITGQDACGNQIFPEAPCRARSDLDVKVFKYYNLVMMLIS